MRADLVNTCLPDRVQSLAIEKQATTVADLLFLTFQTYLPSKPSARVDGLTDILALGFCATLVQIFECFFWFHLPDKRECSNRF